MYGQQNIKTIKKIVHLEMEQKKAIIRTTESGECILPFKFVFSRKTNLIA
jgi:hypothetical protein